MNPQIKRPLTKRARAQTPISSPKIVSALSDYDRAVASLSESCARPHRVLVIEDDPIVARALERHLQILDIDVYIATDSDEALRQYGLRTIDLILTDSIGLPAIRLLRAADSRTPVVVVSGYDYSGDSALAALIGDRGEVRGKPLDTPEFSALLGRWLGEE